MNRKINFQSIFKAISLPCLVLKPQQGKMLVVDANQAYLNMTGIPLSVLQSGTDNAFPRNPALEFHEGDLLLSSLQKVATLKVKDQLKALRYDLSEMGNGNYQEKYWDIENVPALDDQGNLEYVLHLVKDVTDQVLSEKIGQKLQKESEKDKQKFQHFVEGNPDGLYTLDREGNILNANQGLADMLEIPVDKLLKMDFLPFCSEENREFIMENFNSAIQGISTKFEAKFISGVGKELIVAISLVPMKSGGEIAGVYGIARDLTSVRRSEKILVTKKNYLQANAAFINALMQNEFGQNSLQESLAMVGEAVDVERIYYYLAHNCEETKDTFLSLKMEWAHKDVEPQIRRADLQNFPLERMKGLIGDLQPDLPFTANTCQLPEGELKQMLRHQDTKAILVLPVFIKNELQGLVGFNDCVRDRSWSDEELDFLKMLANNLAATFEKQAAEKALKEKEEALIRSEQKFKALVQEGADLIGILDGNGNYLFASDSTTRILGFPPEEFLGKNAFEYIHPDDLQSIQQQFASISEEKQFKIKPYRFRNSGGEWRWLETSVTNLSSDPAVQGIVVNSRDITTLLFQEREIEQINERYRLAATATQDLMYDWDMESGEVIRFHKGRPDFLGHEISEVEKRDFWPRNIHPQELEDLKNRQDQALQDKEQDHIHLEYRFRRADCSYAHIIDRAYIIRDAKGKAIRMVGATSDISEIKANIEAVKFANQRFRLAMKATKEVLWDWNIISGRVTRGKSFEKISGFESSKFEHQTGFWLELIHPEDRERVQKSIFAAVQESGVNKWREEYRLIKANGDTAIVVDRGFIVRDDQGKAVRMVGSALDDTETRRAFKRIKQQNSLLKEIAWDQSHLLRAPLVRIQGLLDLMELKEPSLISEEELLQHLHASTNELDEIIRTIVKKSESVEQDL